MIKLNNKQGWAIHDNGVSLIDEDDRLISNLNDDFNVTGLRLEGNELSLELKSREEHIEGIETNLQLIISGVEYADLPDDLSYPCEFEGIYYYTGNSLDLCIGPEFGYPVKGKRLSIGLFSRKERERRSEE